VGGPEFTHRAVSTSTFAGRYVMAGEGRRYRHGECRRRFTTVQELGLDLDTEVEKAARSTIFADLRIGCHDRPLEPLFTGDWDR
jgi:hypothetical protein